MNDDEFNGLIIHRDIVKMGYHFGHMKIDVPIVGFDGKMIQYGEGKKVFEEYGFIPDREIPNLLFLLSKIIAERGY